MTHDIDGCTVLVGENTLTINAATMIVILTDWLCLNMSGGPYRVTYVESDADKVFNLTIATEKKPDK